jgi:hypothetical protein
MGKMNKEDLLAIEKGFWFEGAEYYNQHITDEAVFVFPGMRLGKEDGVAAADQAPRWDNLDLTDEKLIEITEDVVALTYRAKGQREGQPPYIGNISTVYRLENGEPKMIFHQHTPDSTDSDE